MNVSCLLQHPSIIYTYSYPNSTTWLKWRDLFILRHGAAELLFSAPILRNTLYKSPNHKDNSLKIPYLKRKNGSLIESLCLPYVCSSHFDMGRGSISKLYIIQSLNLGGIELIWCLNRGKSEGTLLCIFLYFSYLDNLICMYIKILPKIKESWRTVYPYVDNCLTSLTYYNTLDYNTFLIIWY